MRIARPLLLGSLLLAACPGSRSLDGGIPASGSAADPVAPPAAAIHVRDGLGAEGPFSIDELEELAVEVRLTSAAAGSHQVRLEVLGPSGALFGQVPVDVEVASNGEGVATHHVQVRGTSIESLRRTGTWRFRVFLSDAGPPLANAEAKVAE